MHLPDVAAVVASLLPAMEREADPANPAQAEAVALLRRAVALLERARELRTEQLTIGVELDGIIDRLQRLNAGVATLLATPQ